MEPNVTVWSGSRLDLLTSGCWCPDWTFLLTQWKGEGKIDERLPRKWNACATTYQSCQKKVNYFVSVLLSYLQLLYFSSGKLCGQVTTVKICAKRISGQSGVVLPSYICKCCAGKTKKTLIVRLLHNILEH